jgi:hypothetical protein
MSRARCGSSAQGGARAGTGNAVGGDVAGGSAGGGVTAAPDGGVRARSPPALTRVRLRARNSSVLAREPTPLTVVKLGKAQTDLRRWADELATVRARLTGAAKLLAGWRPSEQLRSQRMRLAGYQALTANQLVR